MYDRATMFFDATPLIFFKSENSSDPGPTLSDDLVRMLRGIVLSINSSIDENPNLASISSCSIDVGPICRREKSWVISFNNELSL